MSANEVVLSGAAGDIRPLRFTPSGIPVAEFRLRHDSTQAEAGGTRKVSFEMPAVAFGATAERFVVSPPGVEVTARGFLAERLLGSGQIVLHARTTEFVQGH